MTFAILKKSYLQQGFQHAAHSALRQHRAPIWLRFFNQGRAVKVCTVTAPSNCSLPFFVETGSASQRRADAAAEKPTKTYNFVILGPLCYE